jgi:hypothetical protein
MTPGPLELWLGDIVRLRKAHPCGSTSWQVVRLGADIGLVCQGCGRRVLLERRRLEERFGGFEARGDAAMSQAVEPVPRDARTDPRAADPETSA